MVCVFPVLLNLQVFCLLEMTLQMSRYGDYDKRGVCTLKTEDTMSLDLRSGASFGHLSIPPKIKIFLWRACKGYLLTRTNLSQGDWKRVSSQLQIEEYHRALIPSSGSRSTGSSWLPPQELHILNAIIDEEVDAGKRCRIQRLLWCQLWGWFGIWCSFLRERV